MKRITSHLQALLLCALSVPAFSASAQDAPILAADADPSSLIPAVQQLLQREYGSRCSGIELHPIPRRSVDPQGLRRFIVSTRELPDCVLAVLLNESSGEVLAMNIERSLVTTEEEVRNKHHVVLRNLSTGQTLSYLRGDITPQVGNYAGVPFVIREGGGRAVMPTGPTLSPGWFCRRMSGVIAA